MGSNLKKPLCFLCSIEHMFNLFFIDPLTGHERNSELSFEFQKALKEKVLKDYKKTIKLHNEIMISLKPKINEFIKDQKKFKDFTDNEKHEISENFRIIN